MRATSLGMHSVDFATHCSYVCSSPCTFTINLARVARTDIRVCVGVPTRWKLAPSMHHARQAELQPWLLHSKALMQHCHAAWCLPATWPPPASVKANQVSARFDSTFGTCNSKSCLMRSRGYKTKKVAAHSHHTTRSSLTHPTLVDVD